MSRWTLAFFFDLDSSRVNLNPRSLVANSVSVVRTFTSSVCPTRAVSTRQGLDLHSLFRNWAGRRRPSLSRKRRPVRDPFSSNAALSETNLIITDLL